MNQPIHAATRPIVRSAATLWRVPTLILLAVAAPLAALTAPTAEAAWAELAPMLADPQVVPGLHRVGAPAPTVLGGQWQWRLASSEETGRSGCAMAAPGGRRHLSFLAPAPTYVPSSTAGVPAARAVATAFAQRWLPDRYRRPPFRLVLKATPRRPVGDSVEFAWAVCQGETCLPSWLRVWVREWDLRVSGFAWNERPVAPAARPAVDAASAEAAARRALAVDGPARLRLLRCRYGWFYDNPAPAWELWFERSGVPATPGAVALSTVSVDGTSGAVTRHWAGEIPAARLAADLTGELWPADEMWQVTDSSPVWGAKGELLFVSNRSRPGRPIYVDRGGESVFLVGREGLRCLLAPTEEPWADLAGGGRLLVDHAFDDETVALDLDTGTTFRAQAPGGHASPTAVTRDGTLLAYPNRDGGLVLAALPAAGTHAPHVLVPRTDGAACPVFDANGRDVYFAAGGGPGSGAGRCAVWRLDVDKALAGRGQPRLVATGLPRINRLTLSDTGLLLLEHEDGLTLVGKADGAVRPLAWPPLHDPDLPEGPALEPLEPAISPDGRSVAFAAVRSRGLLGEPDATCLYVCGLDGRNLRRVTPPHDVLVRPYVYPRSGRRAFKVQPIDELLLGRPMPYLRGSVADDAG